MKKLKIAQICPPWESCPPKKYGGVELIVFHLCEELTKRGHQVTLFASGDSKISGKLVSVFPKAFYRAGIPWGNCFFPLLHVSKAFEEAEKFDIIHNHFHYFGLAFSRIIKTPVLTTYHGDFATAEKSKDKYLFLKKYRKNYFVSISYDQRKHTSLKLNFLATVYNGIDLKKFKFNPSPKNYLAWLGRITPKKGILEAIKVAKKLKRKLIFAGKIDTIDRHFFEKKIKPLIDGEKIVYLGELSHSKKELLLRNALALLNPIQWNEPFGLVMIEAMACGTPVIAYKKGAAPEIVKDGKTGFIVKNLKEMIKAFSKINLIKRKECRKRVERLFSKEKMAKAYEKIYYKILKKKHL